MKNIFIIPALLSLLVFAGCDKVRQGLKDVVASSQDSDKFKVVRAKQYAISLPDYMTEYKGMNKAASLEYANIYKEFYIIIIDEPKSSIQEAIGDQLDSTANTDADLFNLYCDKVTKQYIENSTASTNKEFKRTKIGSMPAINMTYLSQINGYTVFHNIYLVNGESNYYQLFTWCIDKNKDQYKPVMDKMMHSFHEI